LPEFLSRDGVICHMLVRNQGTQGEKKKNANSVNTTGMDIVLCSAPPNG